MLPCNKGYTVFSGFGQNHDAAQLEQNPGANSNSKHIAVCFENLSAGGALQE